MHLHERVWLLLLLENGSRGLVVLWRVSKGNHGKVFGNAYVFGLGAIGVSEDLLAMWQNDSDENARTLKGPPSASSDLAQPTSC